MSEPASYLVRVTILRTRSGIVVLPIIGTADAWCSRWSAMHKYQLDEAASNSDVQSSNHSLYENATGVSLTLIYNARMIIISWSDGNIAQKSKVIR